MMNPLKDFGVLQLVSYNGVLIICIDWNDPTIKIDTCPFIILPETPIDKIVFLYSMMNVIKIFVVKEGYILGTITKKELLKQRSDRLVVNDISQDLISPAEEFHQSMNKNK